MKRSSKGAYVGVAVRVCVDGRWPKDASLASAYEMLLRRLARGARAAKTWQRTRAAQARAPATRGATSLAQQQHQQQQLVERQEQHHGDELEHLFSAGSSQVRGMQEETEAQGKQLAAQVRAFWE